MSTMASPVVAPSGRNHLSCGPAWVAILGDRAHLSHSASVGFPPDGKVWDAVYHERSLPLDRDSAPFRAWIDAEGTVHLIELVGECEGWQVQVIDEGFARELCECISNSGYEGPGPVIQVYELNAGHLVRR